jgi:hypothetical protein
MKPYVIFSTWTPNRRRVALRDGVRPDDTLGYVERVLALRSRRRVAEGA